MLRWITQNLGWKLLSVALAALLWFLQQSEIQNGPDSSPIAELLREPLLSRDVPVQVRLTGVPPEGYQLAVVESVPGFQRLTGPQRAVSRIEGVPTDPIDISHLKGEHIITVMARPAAARVYLDTPPEVRIRLVVQQKR